MKTLFCCTLLGLSIAAHAAMADGATCADFKHNADGSWSPLKPIEIKNGQGSVTVGPGTSFHEGVQFAGVDLAMMLDQRCP